MRLKGNTLVHRVVIQNQTNVSSRSKCCTNTSRARDNTNTPDQTTTVSNVNRVLSGSVSGLSFKTGLNVVTETNRLSRDRNATNRSAHGSPIVLLNADGKGSSS